MDISLALGGGGVRGIAHIGVIRTLENHGFKIRAIAGTSAGGLVGAVYAAGFSTETIEAKVNEMNQNRSFSRKSNDQPSLLGLSGITDILSDMLGDTTFKELKIPFAATAVSLHTGKEIILRKGKVIDAVLATIAVPGVFPSQEIGGRVLIDGGVMDPVPVRVARWLQPDLPVVAVMLHKTPDGFSESLPQLILPIPGSTTIIEHLTRLRPVQAFQIFAQSIEVASKHLTELSMRVYEPEVIIAPRVGQHNILQEVDANELIDEGVRAAEETLNKIRAEVNWMRKIQRKVRRRIAPDPYPEEWEIVGDK